MKALVGAFNQEKALVGAFSMIVRLLRIDLRHYSLATDMRTWHTLQIQRYIHHIHTVTPKYSFRIGQITQVHNKENSFEYITTKITLTQTIIHKTELSGFIMEIKGLYDIKLVAVGQEFTTENAVWLCDVTPGWVAAQPSPAETTLGTLGTQSNIVPLLTAEKHISNTPLLPPDICLQIQGL